MSSMKVYLAVTFSFMLSSAVCCASRIQVLNQRISISPNLKWEIDCESNVEGDQSIHVLHLSHLGAGDKTRVFGFDRDCDVVWSPDSSKLAITDWLGSNSSEISWYDVGTHRLELLTISNLAQILSDTEREQSHLYFEAAGWENESTLNVRVFGHTDLNPSRGFSYFIGVDLQSKIATLHRKTNTEDGSG